MALINSDAEPSEAPNLSLQLPLTALSSSQKPAEIDSNIPLLPLLFLISPRGRDELGKSDIRNVCPELYRNLDQTALPPLKSDWSKETRPKRKQMLLFIF